MWVVQSLIILVRIIPAKHWWPLAGNTPQRQGCSQTPGINICSAVVRKMKKKGQRPPKQICIRDEVMNSTCLASLCNWWDAATPLLHRYSWDMHADYWTIWIESSFQEKFNQELGDIYYRGWNWINLSSNAPAKPFLQAASYDLVVPTLHDEQIKSAALEVH